VTAKAAATPSTRTEARESWLGRFLDHQEFESEMICNRVPVDLQHAKSKRLER
jgi:hypothetical protein